MVALCTMETETKQVLSASGIDTMYIVFYLDYARQLFRLSHGRSISGATLAREAQVLLEKWQARGGDTSATRSSRRSVDVSPSASPCGNPLRGLQRPRASALAACCRIVALRLRTRGGPSPAPACLLSTVFCLLGALLRHHDLAAGLRLAASAGTTPHGRPPPGIRCCVGVQAFDRLLKRPILDCR